MQNKTDSRRKFMIQPISVKNGILYDTTALLFVTYKTDLLGSVCFYSDTVI